MHPHNPKRKKIRGWKRRIRQVERWGERIEQPYLSHLLSDRGRHTYERCYLSPFYRLDKRQPPLWFYKIIIAQFIKAFQSWEAVFKEIGQPHDLQLWLYDPAYISSEIICYKMQQAGDVKRFSWESDFTKPFPYEKFSSPGYDLTQFDWILSDDAYVHFEDDLDYAEFTEADLFADGYIRKVQDDGNVYFTKRIGDIWIGRRKGILDNNVNVIKQGYYPPPR
ncbi:hypothetical protein ACFQZX_07510 [Mucilaginibacter litoreus]|uniref:DKNYY family protein n=1 Tax=Mucilaginibacter litoreus TaxID=1048221 RepID=A0ABW3ASI4_9SPHI